jgi:hypothetical protein
MCVLEVKSRLQSSHYKSLSTAAYRLSPRNPDGLRVCRPGNLPKNKTFYPLYAIFAFTSDAEKDEFIRAREQVECVEDVANLFKLIGVLDKGVWSQKGGHYPSKINTENIANFLVAFLNLIEETAASRGKFRLQDWL